MTKDTSMKIPNRSAHRCPWTFQQFQATELTIIFSNCGHEIKIFICINLLSSLQQAAKQSSLSTQTE